MYNEFKTIPSYQQFCKRVESNLIYLIMIGQILCNMNKLSKFINNHIIF